MSVHQRRIGAGAIVLLIAGLGLLALIRPQKSPAQQPPAGLLVQQSYDITALLPLLDASQPLRSGNLPPPRPMTEREKVTAMIGLIQENVDPPSWVSRGGTIGTIEIVDQQRIVITQTPLNQQALKEFIAERSTQITVETRMLTGEAVFAAIEKLGEAGQIRWEQLGDAEAWPVFLSEEQASGVIRASQADEKTTMLTAPRLTLFNGQWANVVVQTETAYVADLTPLADGTFDPVVEVIGSGVTLICRAQVRDNPQLVSVTLNPTLTRLLSLDPERRLNVHEGKVTEAFVQIPTVQTATFTQTFAVPGGKWALFRVQSRTTPAKPNAEPDITTLIMVRPTVVQQPEG